MDENLLMLKIGCDRNDGVITRREFINVENQQLQPKKIWSNN